MSDENLAGNAESEKGEDAIISMVDYLKEEEELVEDANAVLGDSDENHCTYEMVCKCDWKFTQATGSRFVLKLFQPK